MSVRLLRDGIPWNVFMWPQWATQRTADLVELLERVVGRPVN
jgi:hypothetical protein